MSAFKEHCSFGFWGEEICAVLREAKVLREDGMGSLGRITSVKDLPSDKLMLGWIRQAAAFVDSGQYTSPIAARRKVVKPQKPALKTPAEFATALQRNKKAAAVFAAFSPSCKREYAEWIADAKRPETRDKRIATASGVDRRGQAAQLEISELLKPSIYFVSAPLLASGRTAVGYRSGSGLPFCSSNSG